MKNFTKRSRRYVRVILIIAMAVGSSVIYAQHGWSFDSDEYESDGEVSAVVVFEGDDVTTGSLGAFVGSECRGYSDRLRYSEAADRYFFRVKVYSDEESDDDDSDDSDNDSGEIITFQYYDGVSFYDIVENVEFTEDMEVGDRDDPVIFNVVTDDCEEYVKTFNEGWNWFSINILMDDMSLDAIMSDGFTNGDNIRNQTQSATYYDNQGWVGSLEFFDPNDFYKAYFHAESEISTCGDIIDLENAAIDLVAGWNYLGYLPKVSMPINEALSSLSPAQFDYIKSQTHSATYYDGLGWWGNLTHMNPGEGYMIFLKNPGKVQYPDPSVKMTVPNK